MPTSPEDPAWGAVEKAVGQPVPEWIRDYVRLEGWDDLWTTAPTADDRRHVLQKVTRSVANLLKASEDLLRSAPTVSMDPGSEGASDDGRWGLWRDLIAARQSGFAAGVASDWAPFVVTRVFDISRRPLYSERIELSVDSRVPLRRVKKELDRFWARMTAEGWVKRSRPLGDRALALVRFVCLDADRHATWRTRLETWNSTHPKDAFDSVQPFQSAFRRAEKQLTGRKYGLAWFYDEEVRAEDYSSLNPHPFHTMMIALEAHQQGDANSRRVEMRLAQVAPLEEIAGRFDYRRAARALGDYVEAEQRAANFDGDPAPSVEEILDKLGDEAEGMGPEDVGDAGIGDWRVGS